MSQEHLKNQKKTSIQNPENKFNNPINTSKKNKQHEPLEEPKNKFSKFFSKAGYTIWVIVIAVGSIIAFLVSLFLL